MENGIIILLTVKSSKNTRIISHQLPVAVMSQKTIHQKDVVKQIQRAKADVVLGRIGKDEYYEEYKGVGWRL